MGLKTLLKQLASDQGVEIDDEELDSLGLADDEESPAPVTDDILSQPLPGRAAGVVELFLAADSTTNFAPVETGDLLWYPIIREGQWAVRPGTTGRKRRVPLKVVAGNSKNQRREIGLEDLLSAFNDEAVQHVTVPSSHNNTVLENQGFIKAMKIVDGTVNNKVTKKDQKVKVLLGGYDITEPETKGKVQRGTVANRSAGILYDYVNTETGKTYPAVVEHVALTNKPWITSMVSFGRKLKEGTADPVAPAVVSLSLSDEGPDSHEYALCLSDEAGLAEDDQDFLAVAGATWDHETSPNWLKCQVNDTLKYARAEKMQAAIKAAGGSDTYVYDTIPSYQCVEAKPGQALVADGWGDDSNYWVAPITVENGTVTLADFQQWQTTKKAYVPDDRPPPPDDQLPLEEGDKTAAQPQKTRLQLAQEKRRQRSSEPNPTNPPTPREVVEHDMPGTENGSTLTLSEEARKIVQAAEDRAKAVEEENVRLKEQLDRTSGTVTKNEVKSYIKWISSDEGLGLSEARGFSGFLVELQQALLADDGEPALQSDHFAQDGNSTGEISFTSAIKRIFGAIEKSEDAKKRLGEALSQPSEPGEPAKEGEGENAGEVTPPGKPGAGETEIDKLSTDEKVNRIAESNPEVARLLRRPMPVQNGGK